MHSDQDFTETALRPGIKRVDVEGQQQPAQQQSAQPVRFLSDGGSKTSDSKGHHSHSHSHQSRRIFKHNSKKLLLAMIPFVIFMVGLSLVSVGCFSYVENESVLAVLITSRDNGSSVDLHSLDSNDSLTPAVLETSVQVADPGDGRLIVPFFYEGDLFGTIRIPSVDIEVGAYQGDSEEEFRLGAGHGISSYFPGQGGNIVLASHRTSYFRNFESLKTGDLVEFETTYGQFTYEIREIKILDSKDFGLITKATEQEQLTMYTCYPFTYIGNAPQRYAVFCDLIESELNT